MSRIPKEHIEPIKKTEITTIVVDQEREFLLKEEEITNTNKDCVSKNSRRHFKYRSTKCLNCAQPLNLTDRFCPYCSQLNSTKALSLIDFFLEFLSSIVSYDSKLRYTVKDLLFKPGTITRNYINGQRLKYSNPFRFFLSVSVIYFLVYSVITFFSPSVENPLIKFNKDNIENELKLKTGNGDSNFKNNAKEIDEAIAVLEANPKTKKWANRIRNSDSIRRIENKKTGKDIRIIQGDTVKKFDYKARKELLKTRNNVEGFFEKIILFRDFYKETDIKSASKALDSLKITQTKTNVWLYNKNKSLERIEKDPLTFVQFLISKTPFFLFFFAPLFALFFLLLYVRGPSTYMEHLVFIFHIFSFIFLVLLITAIPDIVLDSDLFAGILFAVVGPFYFYKALRNFYKQSRLKTIIKFVFLNIIFLISATTAAILFFAATAATY